MTKAKDSKDMRTSVADSVVSTPDFKDWSLSKYYDFSNISADYIDLEDVNKQIAAARVAFFKLTETINTAERRAVATKLVYERSFKREYIKSTEKTETAKKIRAEVMVEDLENKYRYYEQLVSELKRAMLAMKEELAALHSVSNNIRQQLKT